MDGFTIEHLTSQGIDTSSWDEGKLQRFNDFVKLRQTAQNPKEGILGGLEVGAKSSIPMTKAGVGALFGNYDMVTSGLKSYQEVMSELSPELQKRATTLSDPESFTKTLLNMGDDPEAAAVLLGQSLPSSIVNGILAITGGKAASKVLSSGARKAVEMGIFGAGSALNEAGFQILQTMSESGIDITDENQVKAVFEDPELYSALVKDGLKKGIPVGAFDALSYHLAGRHVGAQGLGIKSGLKETAEQAVTGMAGEASGQLLQKGEITDRGSIALEGAFEGVTGVPQAIIQPALRNGIDTFLAPKTKEEAVQEWDYEVDDLASFVERDSTFSQLEDLEGPTPKALGDMEGTTLDTRPVRDRSLEKEVRESVKPKTELVIPKEVLLGTHKQMKSRLMSSTFDELKKKATVNAGIDLSSLEKEKGSKLTKTEVANAILEHYGIVNDETTPDRIQKGRTPASKLKQEKVLDNLPVPEGDTLKQLMSLAKSSPEPNIRNMALEWVHAINSRKNEGSITLPEKESKELDIILTEAKPSTTMESQTELTKPQAIESLKGVKGETQRFNDALKTLIESNQKGIQEDASPVTSTVNPLLQSEQVSEATDKPTPIQIIRQLNSSPTFEKPGNPIQYVTQYNSSGDQRHLVPLVGTVLNSNLLSKSEKSALNLRFPEMVRVLAKEMGVGLDNQALEAVKESSHLQPYLLASLLDSYLNGEIDLKDSPRLKSILEKMKNKLIKEFGPLTPKVTKGMSKAKAISVTESNRQTVKEASSWRALEAYRKLSSDLGVYLDEEPKLVLGNDAFKNASDMSALGAVSRSWDVFRSMPAIARQYPFFQPIMDMYLQRDNFRHTVLQTQLKSAQKLIKQFGEARSRKALEVLEIMSRPHQDTGGQKLKVASSGNVVYRNSEGKLRELDPKTSEAVLAWQGVFKQNLALIAQTVKTDMHQFGIDPTSNDRLLVLNKIDEFRATGQNGSADRLQNGLKLLDVFDEMFSSEEAYFPHIRSRGPYAIAAYAYETDEDGKRAKKPTMVGFYSIKKTMTGAVDEKDLSEVRTRIQEDMREYGQDFVTIDGKPITNAKPFYKTTNALKNILMKSSTNTSLAYEAVSSLLTQKGVDPKVVNDMFDGLKLNHNIEKIFTNLRRKKGYYGYDKDDHLAVVVNYLTTQSSLLTSYRYRPRIDSAFSRISNKLSTSGPAAANLVSKLQRYQEYMTNPEEEWKWIRSLNYWTFLAGNISTAFLQLMSTHLMTVPWVSQMTGFGPDFLRANYKVFTNYVPVSNMLMSNLEGGNLDKLAKTAGISRENAKVLYNLKKLGVLDPGYAVEAVGDVDITLGKSKTTIQKIGRNLANAAGAPMKNTENAGRLNTALLVLDLLNRGNNFEKMGNLLYAKDDGFRARVHNMYKGRVTKEAIIQQAIEENHGVFGKRGRAAFMRGPVGALMFAFQTYPHQMIENLARLAFSRGSQGRKAFIAMMFVYPLLYGGVLAVPMYDTWDWLIKMFAKYTGKRDTNLNLEITRALSDIGLDDDGSTARMIMHGPILSKGLGVDVSQRIGLQAWFQPFLNAFVDPSEAYGGGASDKLVGGFSSFEQNMRQAKSQIREGDDPLSSYTKAFSPTALKNVYKAYDIYSGNIENSRGERVMPPEELLKQGVTSPTGAIDVIWRALGFNPEVISQANEFKYQQGVEDREYTSAYTDYNKKVSRYLQDRVVALKKGDREAAIEAQKQMALVMKDLVEFNKSTRNPKDPEKLMRDVEMAVKKDFYKNMFPLMVSKKDKKVEDVLRRLGLPNLEGLAIGRPEKMP